MHVLFQCIASLHFFEFSLLHFPPTQYMYVCMYAYMHACMYCFNAYRPNTSAKAVSHKFPQAVYLCTCVCMYVCMYACMHACIVFSAYRPYTY